MRKLTLFVMLALLAGAVPTLASTDRDSIDLLSTAVIPGATGRAERTVKTQGGTIVDQSFLLGVNGLAGNSTYSLTVDGAMIASFTTKGGGDASLSFSSSPQGSQLPLPAILTPVTNIKLVEVRNLVGQIVLSGTFGTLLIKRFVTLTSTGVIPGAAGSAELMPTGPDAGLTIQVSSLTPLTVFLVKVDGRIAGALNTDGEGQARLELTVKERPHALPLPASISLATLHLVEVVTEAGLVVLTGAF